MESQFNRAYNLTIDTISGTAIEITDLHIEFTIENTDSSDTNGCRINIYNLNEKNRNQIAKDGNVKLSVGYLKQGLSELYIGQISSFFSYQNGPDIITSLTLGDGYQPVRDARVSKTYAANITAGAIIRDLARIIGVAVGTISSVKPENGEGISKRFERGYAASGQARDVLDDITGLCDLEWSIQSGSLIVLPKGGTRFEAEVEVRKETGLIGTPSPTSQSLGKKKTQKTKDGIRFQTLINPVITVGRRVKVFSKLYPNGTVIRANKVIHKGSFRGVQWFTSVEGEIIA